MNSRHQIDGTHSFAFPFSGEKHEEFVKKGDRDQIACAQESSQAARDLVLS